MAGISPRIGIEVEDALTLERVISALRDHLSDHEPTTLEDAPDVTVGPLVKQRIFGDPEPKEADLLTWTATGARRWFEVAKDPPPAKIRDDSLRLWKAYLERARADEAQSGDGYFLVANASASAAELRKWGPGLDRERLSPKPTPPAAIARVLSTIDASDDERQGFLRQLHVRFVSIDLVEIDRRILEARLLAEGPRPGEFTKQILRSAKPKARTSIAILVGQLQEAGFLRSARRTTDNALRSFRSLSTRERKLVDRTLHPAESNWVIDREELRARIECTSGHLLVHGTSGVGKSALLATAADAMENRALFLPATTLEQPDAPVSDAEETLSAFVHGGGTTLFVDAFDELSAPKGMAIAGRFIQVALGVKGLRVVVSSRRAKAHEMSFLDRADFQLLEIPDLSSGELRAFAEHRPSAKLDFLFTDRFASVRDLVRNPFRLRILLSLVRGAHPTELLAGLVTQEQLLLAVWSRRLDDDEQSAARRVAARMLEHERDEIGDGLVETEPKVLTSLTEHDILRSRGGRVRFSARAWQDFATALAFEHEDVGRDLLSWLAERPEDLDREAVMQMSIGQLAAPGSENLERLRERWTSLAQTKALPAALRIGACEALARTMTVEIAESVGTWTDFDERQTQLDTRSWILVPRARHYEASAVDLSINNVILAAVPHWPGAIPWMDVAELARETARRAPESDRTRLADNLLRLWDSVTTALRDDPVSLDRVLSWQVDAMAQCLSIDRLGLWVSDAIRGGGSSTLRRIIDELPGLSKRDPDLAPKAWGELTHASTEVDNFDWELAEVVPRLLDNAPGAMTREIILTMETHARREYPNFAIATNVSTLEEQVCHEDGSLSWAREYGIGRDRLGPYEALVGAWTRWARSDDDLGGLAKSLLAVQAARGCLARAGVFRASATLVRESRDSATGCELLLDAARSILARTPWIANLSLTYAAGEFICALGEGVERHGEAVVHAERLLAAAHSDETSSDDRALLLSGLTELSRCKSGELQRIGKVAEDQGGRGKPRLTFHGGFGSLPPRDQQLDWLDQARGVDVRSDAARRLQPPRRDLEALWGERGPASSVLGGVERLERELAAIAVGETDAALHTAVEQDLARMALDIAQGTRTEGELRAWARGFFQRHGRSNDPKEDSCSAPSIRSGVSAAVRSKCAMGLLQIARLDPLTLEELRLVEMLACDPIAEVRIEVARNVGGLWTHHRNAFLESVDYWARNEQGTDGTALLHWLFQSVFGAIVDLPDPGLDIIRSIWKRRDYLPGVGRFDGGGSALAAEYAASLWMWTGHAPAWEFVEDLLRGSPGETALPIATCAAGSLENALIEKNAATVTRAADLMEFVSSIAPSSTDLPPSIPRPWNKDVSSVIARAFARLVPPDQRPKQFETTHQVVNAIPASAWNALLGARKSVTKADSGTVRFLTEVAAAIAPIDAGRALEVLASALLRADWSIADFDGSQPGLTQRVLAILEVTCLPTRVAKSASSTTTESATMRRQRGTEILQRFRPLQTPDVLRFLARLR